MPTLHFLVPVPLLSDLTGWIVATPLPPLDAGSLQAEFGTAIERFLSQQRLTDLSVKESRLIQSLGAALYLLAGDLDRSHSLSQSIESKDGSFWHGVMHRREGDFSNAKYWFDRVGVHPGYKALNDALEQDELARTVLPSGWDATEFVDQSRRAVRTGGENLQACLHVQWIEWQVMVSELLLRPELTQLRAS